MIEAFHLLVGLWLFVLGSVVGSFLNVCIYRIPWQKSVIWPGSHCPKCLNPIAARDNIPIVSWLALRGECRHCGLPISPRYALVELLVGLLFAAVFYTDVAAGRAGILGFEPYARMVYHLVLVCLLVAATFIDYDLQIIPDSVTVPGMVIGLLVGAWLPGVRPEPATAQAHWEGLKVGLVGLGAGAGLTWGFRAVFSKVFGREAMGFGDVTLMGMIGSVLGWQAAVLTFFLAPFFGLAHAGWKAVKFVGKLLRRAPVSGSDRELAFGPYLSMAAVALLLTWNWFWPGVGRAFFENLHNVFWFLVSGDLGPGPGELR
jgi:leader peptidase (prepilin peptidase)/N-methyltransferase